MHRPLATVTLMSKAPSSCVTAPPLPLVTTHPTFPAPQTASFTNSCRMNSFTMHFSRSQTPSVQYTSSLILAHARSRVSARKRCSEPSIAWIPGGRFAGADVGSEDGGR